MRMALAKKVVWTLVASCALALGVMSSGCAASGVGDPCIPEAIPELGFTNRESYVETSSVQCRTRVCLVYRLQGHPERILGDSATCDPRYMSTCITPEARDERVFCSCRCSAGTGGDTNLPLCECNEGFHCVDLLTQGGAGVRGGYCIRSEFCEDNEDCTAGQRCVGNTCTTG